MPSADAGNSAVELAELGRLFPQLEVLDLVGRGGMGVVYKARQRGLDRLVALKILPPQVDRDPGFRERFVREARALARLNHPNIVAVYDFGQVEGRYYFLMEFVDGANLRTMLQGAHLKPQEAMAIVPQLCDALQFAHEEGIVHRDIKPENILLDRKGRVKIADFGLAKLLGASIQQDPYTLTSPQQVLGTPHYMAPEQFEHPGTVDHRADIYSMGVVFYEMLTGELPLGRFPPPSRRVQVDVRLDEVVLRTLEKSPEQRYQRAGEVKTELASLATLPPDGGPPTWSARAAGPQQALGTGSAGRRRQISRMAIAGLLAAMAFPAAGAVLGLRFVRYSVPLTEHEKFALRDTTWGAAPTSVPPSPGHPIQLMAIRGSNGQQLIGNAADQKRIGRNDAELRVFVQFDPVTPNEAQNWTPFRESEDLPSAPPRRPVPILSTAPQAATRDGQAPAIGGSTAEGTAR